MRSTSPRLLEVDRSPIHAAEDVIASLPLTHDRTRLVAAEVPLLASAAHLFVPRKHHQMFDRRLPYYPLAGHLHGARLLSSGGGGS